MDESDRTARSLGVPAGILIALLIGMGLLNLSSATAQGAEGVSPILRRQLISLAVGGLLFGVAVVVDYRRLERFAPLLFLGSLLLLASTHAFAEVIRVGSKNFNESYVLGELVAQTLEAEGFEVERKLGLGGTLICYEALRNGEIDVYVEYTGKVELTPGVQKALAGEGETDFGEQYFMTTPRMQTGDPRYQWVNNVVCVARGRLSAGRVDYEVYQVTNG